MKHLDIGEFFTDTGKLDGFSGDGTNRQGGAAAGIAIELCEDDAGERDGRIEGFGNVHRVLPGHSIDHK